MDAEKEKEAEKEKKNAESTNSTFFFTTSKLDLFRYLVLREIIGKNIRIVLLQLMFLKWLILPTSVLNIAIVLRTTH